SGAGGRGARRRAGGTAVVGGAMLILASAAALLATAVLAIALQRSVRATAVIYGLTLAVSLGTAAVALHHLSLGAGAVSLATLPLGLPWLGAHFRLDPLAAFFLFIVGLGGAAASLYAVGYGRG